MNRSSQEVSSNLPVEIGATVYVYQTLPIA